MEDLSLLNNHQSTTPKVHVLQATDELRKIISRVGLTECCKRRNRR